MVKRVDIPYYDKTENIWKLNKDDKEYKGNLNSIVNIFTDNKHVYKYKINNDIKKQESFEDVLAEIINSHKEVTFKDFEYYYSEQELNTINKLINKLAEKEKSEPVLIDEWTLMYEYEVVRLLRKNIKENQKDEDIRAYKAKHTYDKVLISLVLLMLIGLVLIMLSINLIGKDLITLYMAVYVMGSLAVLGINQILYGLWYGKPYIKFLYNNKIEIINARNNN